MSEERAVGSKRARGGGGSGIDRFALTEVIPPPRDFVFFEAERCTGCGNCVSICPMDLWRKRGGGVELSAGYRERCMECGSCFIACEAGAIDFTYPAAGTGVVYRYA